MRLRSIDFDAYAKEIAIAVGYRRRNNYYENDVITFTRIATNAYHR